MEIYKAAQEPAETKTWYVQSVGDSEWTISRDLSDALVANMPQGVECSMSELLYITKQRGGVRHFKSIDAALNAAQQIGMASIEVRF